MGTIIILVLICIISFILSKIFIEYDVDSSLFVFGVSNVIVCILSFCVSVLLIVSIVSAHTYSGYSKKETFKERRESLIMALEEENNITINNQLYKDIQEYNTELRETKHWSNSFWTNWFYYDNYSDIEYIVIEKE